MKCAHCSAKAVGRCAWPVDKITPVRARDVRFGETFVSPQTKRLSTVVEIYTPNDPDFVNIRVVYSTRRGKQPAPEYTYLRGWNDTVEVLRPGACDVAVCESHARDVGGRVYCIDHWKSWESIYAVA